jgi:hypothetical protein
VNGGSTLINIGQTEETEVPRKQSFDKHTVVNLLFRRLLKKISFERHQKSVADRCRNPNKFSNEKKQQQHNNPKQPGTISIRVNCDSAKVQRCHAYKTFYTLMTP